jgi:cytochrome c-type biogenesis protein CcmH
MAIKSLSRRQFLLTAAGVISVPALALSVPETEGRIRAIEELLVAPCCWRQPISNHQSPEAEAMRAEVRKLVTAGKSRQEILAALVDKYGTRVLASPPARGFFLLAYLTPPLSLACGAFSLAFFIRRALSRRKAIAVSDRAVPPRANVLDAYSDRIEAELQGWTPTD